MAPTVSMPFWLRALLIVAAIMASVFVVPAGLAALGAPPTVALAAGFAVAVGGGNGALYLALRCPKCRKWAGRLPSGQGVAWPGFRCRYCGTPY